jgi:hypothetical protein
MIRNNKLLIAAGAAALSTCMYSTMSTAASVTANASANVLAPLAIAAGANAMNFGDVSGDATAATTVVLTTAGTTSSPDGASTAGTPSAGDFDVTGAPGLAYDITLPADGVVVLTNAAGPDMSVDSFTSSLGASGTLSAGGTQSFTVGATLTINTNQAAALYTGTYDVTVNYQ